MDIYSLSRSFWDWSFENPDKIKPNHIAMYFFAIEHCNRLGWKSKFGFPTTMVMDALGIKSYNTFIKTLNELVEYGFIEMVEKSKNQYSSNIIALSKNDKANDKALDKAMMKHLTKQSEPEADLTFPKESDAIEAIPPDSGKGRPLKLSPKEEDSNPTESEELVKKATDSIAAFFNISEMLNSASYIEIGRFVQHLANADKMPILRDQFNAYKELKALDGCKHSWRNYIGDPREKYQNGSWCEKTWKLELADYRKKQGKQPSGTPETPTVLSAPRRANRTTT